LGGGTFEAHQFKEEFEKGKGGIRSTRGKRKRTWKIRFPAERVIRAGIGKEIMKDNHFS